MEKKWKGMEKHGNKWKHNGKEWKRNGMETNGKEMYMYIEYVGSKQNWS